MTAGLEALELADWRRRVAELYAAARAAGGGEEAWSTWRGARDRLLAHHPQTPVAAQNRSSFRGAGFFPYDPAWRTVARVEPIDAAPAVPIGHRGAGETTLRPVGRVRAEGPTASGTLTLLWLEGYGGGLFLPFRDATCGAETYGGGRYVLDTVKGADLGGDHARLVVDFNYAYHPSCAHDPRWSCPLAPPENHLEGPVRAGERSPASWSS